MGARVGAPEEDGGVEVERATEQLERVVDRLVDLLDARARQSLFRILLLGIGSRLPCAEEPIAARILAETFELALDTRAGGHTNARDLGPEQQQVQESERGREARLGRQGLEARLAERLVADERIEDDDPADDGEAGHRPPERGNERHEHVRRRGEASGERAVEPQEYGVEPDREERAELEIEEEGRITREAELRPQPLAEEEGPDDGREDGNRSERSGGASRDHPSRQHAGRNEPIAGAGEAANEERRTNERVHLSEPSGRGTACELHEPRRRYQGANGGAKGTANSATCLTARPSRPSQRPAWKFSFRATPESVHRRRDMRRTPW